jgi:cephalosporin hydroxylase
MIEITWTASQKIVELNMLQEFLADKEIKTVLEIGTFYGGTALLWAKIVERLDGRVYCIDTDFHPGKQVYSNTPWDKYIIEISGNSHNPGLPKTVRNLSGGDFDMLFIDGDHSYEGVKNDFIFYSPLVKKNGYIIFHDILDTEYHRNLPPPDGPCLVALFWNKIKGNYPNWEFIDPNDQSMMGIGVLQL